MTPTTPQKFSINYTDEDLKSWFINNYIQHVVRKAHPQIVKQAEKEYMKLAKPSKKKLAPAH